MGKLAWFAFYPGDWMKDPELRAVSAGARGLWIDMLSLMFESVRRGYLQFNNGKIVSAENLARMTGNSTDDVSHWLQELETSGVLSRTDDGTIYSRRQVRDETRRANGRERVTKFRRNKDVTQDVTPIYDSDSVSDVASQKSEPEAKPRPDKEVPDGLHALEYSRRICEHLELPTEGNMRPIASAIEAVATKHELSYKAAFIHLFGKVKEAMERGDKLNRWWFQDAKWKETGNHGGKQSEFDAAYRDAEEALAADSGSLQQLPARSGK